MLINKDLPKKIPVFPLSNFIIFPKTTVPLNIFEPRYIQMIDDSMKSNRYIGMIQPKKTGNLKKPDLHKIGCVGKITSFNETEDGRYLIVLNGVCRYETISEINSDKLYRECEVNFEKFSNDLIEKNEQVKFSDLKQVFNDLKKLFEQQGYQINWNDLEKQNVGQTINTLSMASPFTLEEKQILLETRNLIDRKKKLEEILITYTNYNFANKTIQ
jgi:Lon protease-like protein